MELMRRNDKEDGRIVYIYTIPGCDTEMPVYKSDIQSGIVTPDEVLQRLIDIRDSSRNNF